MKTIFRRLTCFGILILATSVSRAALPPVIVGADARWVVYADFNAMRTSELGKELIEIARKSQFESTVGMIAIDFQKVLATVGSVTAYGTNSSPDAKVLDGVMVIQGTEDLRKIAEGVLVHETVTNPKHVLDVTDFPFPAYAITDGKDAQQLVIAFPPEPIILISKSKPQITNARNVFRGEAASLAKVPAAPLGRVLADSSNAYFFGATTMEAGKLFGEINAQARILQLASSGLVSLGERDGNMFAHASLIAPSEEMAVKLMKILQGMTAMLSLGESNDKQLAEFMNSVAVKKNKEAVTLDLSYPSARIVQMIKSFEPNAVPPRGIAPSVPVIPRVQEEKVVSTWKAEAPAASGVAGVSTLAWHTIENVKLLTGTTISLITEPNGPGSVHLDRIEVSPAGAVSAPMVFRAEYMKLNGYSIEDAPDASGGKWISTQQPTNTARLQFRGGSGLYTMRIGYLADAGSKASFSVVTKEPSTAAEKMEK
ncbi:MAG: hypothetical protein JWL90_1236 [Chthoniobacteraceae bacterium]|nr:hypothetical protein [Chthoniobacteraceae bacterium]